MVDEVVAHADGSQRSEHQAQNRRRTAALLGLGTAHRAVNMPQPLLAAESCRHRDGHSTNLVAHVGAVLPARHRDRDDDLRRVLAARGQKLLKTARHRRENEVIHRDGLAMGCGHYSGEVGVHDSQFSGRRGGLQYR